MKTFFFFFGEHLHLDRKTVQISGKTFFFFFFFFQENTFIWTEKPFKFRERPFFFFFFFFFFFLENTSIWAEKTVSILTEKRNASSHFSGKSLLPPQIILSSYGHVYNSQSKTTMIIQKPHPPFSAPRCMHKDSLARQSYPHTDSIHRRLATPRHTSCMSRMRCSPVCKRKMSLW